MAVNKERKLLKIRPSQGIRPYKKSWWESFASTVPYFAIGTFFIGSGVISALSNPSLLTWILFVTGGMFVVTGIRPAVLALHGLEQCATDRNDYQAFESKAQKQLAWVSTSSFMGVLDVACLEMELSAARAMLGFAESGEQYARSAVERTEAALTQFSRDLEKKQVNEFLGLLKCNLSSALFLQDRFVEAEQVAIEAQQLLDESGGYYNKEYAKQLRISPLITLGWVQLQFNELARARITFEEAARLWEEAIGDTTHGDICADSRQAQIMMSLAIVDAKDERIEDSLEYFNAFKELLQVASSDVRFCTIEDLNILCEEYSSNGRFEDAESAIGIAYDTGNQIPFNRYAIRTLDVYEKLLRDTNREPEIQDMRLRVRPNVLTGQ